MSATHRLPVPSHRYLKPAAITAGAFAVAFTAWQAALRMWPSFAVLVSVAFAAVYLWISLRASDWFSGDVPLVPCSEAWAAAAVAGELPADRMKHAAEFCAACPSDTECPRARAVA